MRVNDPVSSGRRNGIAINDRGVISATPEKQHERRSEKVFWIPKRYSVGKALAPGVKDSSFQSE
ncbi:MAG: hypothetical protein ACK5Q2_07145 [Bacteroidota bacterium]|jgi:hypothetical protein